MAIERVGARFAKVLLLLLVLLLELVELLLPPALTISIPFGIITIWITITAAMICCQVFQD